MGGCSRCKTTLITEPPVEREPKAVHAVVVRTRNFVIAAILVALFASSAGVMSGVVAAPAQAFDTPGPRGAHGAQGVAGVDGELRVAGGYRGKRGRAGKNGANGANGVNGVNGATVRARGRRPTTTSTSHCRTADDQPGASRGRPDQLAIAAHVRMTPEDYEAAIEQVPRATPRRSCT